MRIQRHKRRKDFSLSCSLLKLTLMVEVAQADLFVEVLIIESILIVNFETIVVKLVVSKIGERAHFGGFERKALSLWGGLCFLK